jgi:hypothetical protein
MTSIGLMFAVGIMVYGFSAPASGWLSDRLGRIQVTFGASREAVAVPFAWHFA